MNNMDVKEFIDKLENKYNDISDIFTKIISRNKTEQDLAEILSFQEKLSRTLYSISIHYNKSKSIQTEIKRKKSVTSAESFLESIRCISNELYVLRESTAIGKMIGDSFAWIFYQNDPLRLSQHRKHKSLSLLPTGIGGLGEITFISNVKYIGNYLVIYHGITSILRYGDVSLVDLNTGRVSAIGELKTKQGEAPDRLKIQLTLIGSEKDVKTIISKAQCTQAHKETINDFIGDELPTEKMRARFIRQQQVMGNAENEANVNIPEIKLAQAKSYFDKLEEMEGEISNDLALKPISDYLFAILIKIPETSFYERLSLKLDKKIVGDLMKDSEICKSLANNLFIKGRTDNQLIFCTLAPTNKENPFSQIGMPPLLFWPLKRKTLKDILLRKTIINTVYNPAHLYKKLEEKGFEISAKKNRTTLRYHLGDKVVELNNVDYYHRMISYSFVSVDSVIDVIMKFVQTSDPFPNATTPTRVELLLSTSYKRASK